MRAIIHSYDPNHPTKPKRKLGKASQVTCSQYDVSAKPSRLIITGEDCDFIGTGERGGTPIEMRRALTLQLTLNDLKILCNAAIKAGLLTASFDEPIKKGRNG